MKIPWLDQTGPAGRCALPIQPRAERGQPCILELDTICRDILALIVIGVLAHNGPAI